MRSVRFWVYSEGGATVEALDMGGEGNKDMKDGLAPRWPLGAESYCQPTASKEICNSGQQPQGTGLCRSPE